MTVIFSKQLIVPTYNGSGGSGGGSTSSTLVSDLEEGSVVLISENGIDVEFYVAKHDYESSLNGVGRTLLVRKDLYGPRTWNTTLMNTYASSTIDAWLNVNYKSMLDESIQELIATTTFRYTPGGEDMDETTLARSVFILSASELSLDTTSGAFSHLEGSALPIASTLQIGYYNGTAANQWTRSPNRNGTAQAIAVSEKGNPTSHNTTASTTYVSATGNTLYYCARPCFTVPSTTLLKTSSGGSGSGGSGSGSSGDYTIYISGSSSSSYVEIGGIQYTSDAEVPVAKGTVISVSSLFVYLNGEDVAPTDGSAYKYTVTSDVSITIEQYAITITPSGASPY